MECKYTTEYYLALKKKNILEESRKGEFIEIESRQVSSGGWRWENGNGEKSINMQKALIR